MGHKKKHRMNIPRVLAEGILLIIAAAAGAGLILGYVAPRRQRQEQESLAVLASSAAQEPETVRQEAEAQPETVPYVSPVDFETLRGENPDTIGWITVPNTKIDYPIVWREGDAEYYLHKSFEGADSVYGTIYLDSSSEPDFSGWNHPIYGHHMKDGSMFRDVVKFKDREFFEANRYFTIYTPEREIRLKTLGCYYCTPESPICETKFQTTAIFNKWVKERLAPCSFAEIPDMPIDSMFVLVTCSYEEQNTWTVLYAAEVNEDGSLIPADVERDRKKPGAVIDGLEEQIMGRTNGGEEISE